jgi:hypothetical protein
VENRPNVPELEFAYETVYVASRDSGAAATHCTRARSEGVRRYSVYPHEGGPTTTAPNATPALENSRAAISKFGVARRRKRQNRLLAARESSRMWTEVSCSGR